MFISVLPEFVSSGDEQIVYLLQTGLTKRQEAHLYSREENKTFPDKRRLCLDPAKSSIIYLP